MNEGLDERPNRDGLAAVAISLLAVLLIAFWPTLTLAIPRMFGY